MRPLLLVLGLAGCPAHVMLDPPPPATSSAELRAGYYEQHRPLPPARRDLVRRARLLERAPTYTPRVLRLENGAEIAWVEDLRPLVAADSGTAVAIDASVDARGRADLITAAGVGTFALVSGGGGGVLAAYLIASPHSPGPAPNFLAEQPVLVGVTGLVAGALVGGGLVTWGMLVRDDEEDARVAVFKALDASLRARLALP